MTKLFGDSGAFHLKCIAMKWFMPFTCAFIAVVLLGYSAGLLVEPVTAIEKASLSNSSFVENLSDGLGWLESHIRIILIIATLVFVITLAVMWKDVLDKIGADHTASMTEKIWGLLLISILFGLPALVLFMTLMIKVL